MRGAGARWARWAIGRGAFPVTLATSLAVVHTRWAGADTDGFLLVTGTILASGIAILVMQRVHPAVHAWRNWGDDAIVDLLHLTLSTGGGGEGVRALLFGALYAAAAALTRWVGASVWPETWPWWAQFVVALLVSDLAAYAVHRLSHAWEPAWRFHALHHSSERLHTFSSGRNHPVHSAFTYAAQMTPLILLGAPTETVALLSVFTGVLGLLQHSNIAFVHGPLNWVFATADLHRWHHSARRAESSTNYGNNLIVWDIVFGTRRLPSDRRLPDAVGHGPNAAFPRDFLGHLASPWTWRGTP